MTNCWIKSFEEFIPPLSPHLSQVWGADLDQIAENFQGFQDTHNLNWNPLLSPEERDRAERIQMPVARRRFVVGRGLLRRWLGAYLGQDPADISLVYGSYGKPDLVPVMAAPVVFNLAHSGSVLVMAFGLGDPIGVDVEQVRPHPQMERVIQRRFSPHEQYHCQQAPSSKKLRTFLEIWTAKEACLKAQGLGIRHLSQVEWIHKHLAKQGSQSWHLYGWDPTPTTVATLALPIQPAQTPILEWRWIQARAGELVIPAPDSGLGSLGQCDTPPLDPRVAHRDH